MQSRPTGIDAATLGGMDQDPAGWHSDGVLTVVAQESPRPWDEIPGVAVIGLIIGLVVIVAAIRYMINKK